MNILALVSQLIDHAKDIDDINPAISEAVKNLGYVNGFNIGVKAAIASLNKNGSPSAGFTKDQPISFLVVIFKKV